MVPDRGESRPYIPALTIIAVAVFATAAGLANGFAYDDVPIIAENALLHDIRQLPVLLGRAYWPDDGNGLLWRPVATMGFALQWAVGGGAPWVFHAGNLLLAVACALLVHQVSLRVLSPRRALAAGVLFACLPVHVEVTGNVVGQAELWCALWLLLASVLFLDRPAAPDRGRAALVGICCGLAAMSKEQGFTAPAVLLALEWVRPEGPRPWRTVFRDLTTPVLILVALLCARTLLLGGFGGGPTVAPLAGLSMTERTIAMLGVVPRILQTLVFPSRLVADYNPGDVAIGTQMAAVQWTGLLLLVLITCAAALSARRRESLAALAAAVAAFAPVANVLVPTGVVFAERHLFLPSTLLVLVPLLALPPIRHGFIRSVAVVTVGVVTLLGVARSWVRMQDWRDTPTLFGSIVRDAPKNYRGLMLWASVQTGAGRFDSAEVLLRRSLAGFDRDARPWDDLGQLIRRREGCAVAVPYFIRALELQPDREIARSRLRVCLRPPKVPAR